MEAINLAFKIGAEVSKDLEVIAIHGGKSKDNTGDILKVAQKKFPKLVVLDLTSNKEGYAVIKHGFKKSTKDWVFYTDGDLQYDINQLKDLVREQTDSKTDVINGYKVNRGDGIVRHILGDIYAKVSSFIFELPIRDTDCDFRLIKKTFLDKFDLVSTDSSILGELIKKLEIAGASFSEVPVKHFDRKYGTSNYSAYSLFKEKLIGDFKLYFKLKNLQNFESKFRIFKFGSVGLISVLIQLFIFNLLLIYTSLAPFFATIVADQFAVINSFWLNNRFTFKDRKHQGIKGKLRPFSKFYLIVLGTTIIQAFIVYLGTTFFGESVLVSNLFFLIVVIIAFVLNYTIQKRIVWN